MFVILLCFRLLRYVLTMVVCVFQAYFYLFVVYGFGICVDVCVAVCVAECCLFLESGCCLLCCYVVGLWDVVFLSYL